MKNGIFNKEAHLPFTKLLLFGFIFSILLSCQKETKTSDELDATTIQTYISNHQLTMSKTSEGVYYSVYSSSSSTISPTLQLWSLMSITYTCRILNSNQVDAASVVVDKKLGNLVDGLQKSLPNMTQLGCIRVIVPSSLAYGRVGNTALGIAGNSILDFDITVISVTTNPNELY